MDHGNVVLLNGTSSAGKSSIARAMQIVMERPYLHTGVDHFLPSLPRWCFAESDGTDSVLSEYFLLMYGHADGIRGTAWPAFDADVARAEELEIPVQVNGKLRDVVRVSPSIGDAELEALARASANVQAHTAGKTIAKVVIVPGRKLVSIVAK